MSYPVVIELSKVFSALLHLLVVDVSKFFEGLLQTILVLLVKLAVHLVDLRLFAHLNLKSGKGIFAEAIIQCDHVASSTCVLKIFLVTTYSFVRTKKVNTELGSFVLFEFPLLFLKDFVSTGEIKP